MAGSSEHLPRVAVLGAGVVGLSVALRLSESALPLELTVMADKFSPDTTSDRAGGVFVPYTIGAAKEAMADIKRWCIATSKYFKALYESDAAREAVGMSMADCFLPELELESVLPWIHEVVFDFEVVDPTAENVSCGTNEPTLKGAQSKSSECSCKEVGADDSRAAIERSYVQYASKAGHKFCKYRSYVIEGERYLPWLMKKFQDNGGSIERRRVGNLSELSRSFDLVINCTGLGSRELVKDTSIYPIRGQMVTVKNSANVSAFLVYKAVGEIWPYVIGRKDVVLLGGTTQANNWSTSPDPETAHMIYEACMERCPPLQGSEVTGGWACLRPARETIRLELDESCDGHVIHCYGHGGQGYALHWGCAEDVEKIVKKFFKHAD